MNAVGRAVTGALFNLLVKFYIFLHHFMYWGIFTSLVMFYILGKNYEIVRFLIVLSLEVGSSRPSSELGCCGLWKEANTMLTGRGTGSILQTPVVLTLESCSQLREKGNVICVDSQLQKIDLA